VGVDVERIERFDGALADSIRTPAERDAGWPEADPDRHFSSLWSSKEALAKALGDPRRLDGPAAWPQGRSGPWRATAVEVTDGHVAWLCWAE
jgi:phosphopantetheine--protein transferase-like protein